MGMANKAGSDIDLEESLKIIIVRLYSFIAVGLLSTYIAVLPLGIYIFYFTPEGIEFSSKNVSNLVMYLFYSSSLRLTGPFSIGSIFILLTLIFSVAFATAFFSNKYYLTSLKDFFRSTDPSKITANFLLLMPALCSLALFSFSAINRIAESVGLPVGDISFSDPFQEILFTSYAAGIEELSFRLIPIAFPVAVYLLFRASSTVSSMPLRKRLVLIPMALLKPASFQARLAIPTDRDLKSLEIILVLCSSLLFAYAHIVSGTWGTGKLITTFIGGLMLGYCCIRYGFDSALIIHWFFNTYWSVLSLSADISFPFSLLNDFSYNTTLYLGFLSLIVLAYAVAYWVLCKRRTLKVST